MDAIFLVGESVRTLLRQSESLHAILEGQVSSDIGARALDSEDIGSEEHGKGKRILAVISNSEHETEEGRCLKGLSYLA